MRSLCRVLALGAVFSSSLLVAGLINPGFETGDLTGWTAAGTVSVVTSDTGPYSGTTIYPYTGSYFALLYAGALDESTVETALGLDAGSLASLVSGLTYGSYMDQTVTMGAGETILEYAYFQAEDYPPFDDFGFWSFVGPGTSQFGLIGSVDGVGAGGGTGWVPVSFTAPSAGDYTIGFGVFNQIDNALPSRLAVDDVPEPASLTLLGLGLTALGLTRRRQAR